MAIVRYTLDVPRSEDGRTTFAEVADILDHLATVFGWHSDAHAFLVTRADQARAIDRIYELEPDATHQAGRPSERR